MRASDLTPTHRVNVTSPDGRSHRSYLALSLVHAQAIRDSAYGAVEVIDLERAVT